MLIVGLTGGIGCGKSLVSNLFHQQYNTPVIDADVITKELTQSKRVISQISAELGSNFVDKNNQLARESLRHAIFSNPNLRDKLENILHPLVYEEILKKINALTVDYCLAVIPLLLENKRTDFLDRILVVDCTVVEQIARVMQRDMCSESHVKDIISTQIDRKARLSFADDVIVNSGSIEAVKEQVDTLHTKYSQMSTQLTNHE